MTIRPATAQDWPRISALSELLVHAHHTYDASRFIPVDALPGDVYAARVLEEIAGGRGTVLVADVDGSVVGYVFAGIEAESWKELRHQAGFVHDLVVEEGARRGGVGAALLERAVEWFTVRGVTRVMLWTAPQNVQAQRLFRRIGFRETMIEMTLGRR